MGALPDVIQELILPKGESPPAYGKVALAWIHGENVRARFMRSVIDAISYDRGVIIADTLDNDGLYVPTLRNDVVRRFLDGPADWLWFLDSDMAFPPETLYEMLDGTQQGRRKILAAAYWSNYAGGPHLTWLVHRDDAFYPLDRVPGAGYYELAGCGMGCTLIHRDVFLDVQEDREEDPDPWTWFGHDVVGTKHGPIRMGDDLTFCLRARRAGHPTWGYCDLTVEHYKVSPQPKAVSDG